MAHPHVIRLRGPWDLQPLAHLSRGADGSPVESVDNLPPAQRINPLTDWGAALGAEFRGRVRYSRRFNRPTGLDASERVWLIVEGVDGRGQCSLDGQPLFTIEGYALAAAADITAYFRSNNGEQAERSGQRSLGSVIDIDVELLEQQPAALFRPGRELFGGGLLGDVRLEIRSHAFVEDLAIWWEHVAPPQLHITGRVYSEQSAERLTLVTSACERELDYRTVTTGESFHINVPVNGWPAWPDALDEPVLTPIEIRLLGGATTLWQTTCETAPPQPASEPTRRAMLAAAESAAALTRHDYFTAKTPQFEQLLTRPGAVIGVGAVLPAKVYDALDRANVGVVQWVPTAWAAQVCPRLSPHPSIVAWAIDAAERDALAALATDGTSYGRRWLTI